MMFREKVTEALPGMGQEFRVPPMKVLEMRQEIGQARAIRLDEKARKLVDHYMDGLSQTAVEDILVSMQLPWPRMWMEFPAEDGRDSGILFIQDAKKLTCEFYEESIGDPLYAIYPPVVRIVMDRVAETYRVEATEVCRTMMVVMGADPESREELNALLEENRLQGITHVARAAVLSVLLQAREILEVRPPRYLKTPPIANETRSLVQILGDGPPDPDQVKRLTRAGMGPCQGRRCREQIQALLALQEDLALGAVPLAGYRSPVRPMTLAEATAPEDPAIAEVWDSWFGMPRQWVPFWDVEPQYTVAALATEKEHVSE